MGPKGGALEPLLLVDRSLSASLHAMPAPADFAGEVRDLGSTTEVVTHREILLALRQVLPGRQVTVWTDLPAPSNLPPSWSWEGADGAPSRLDGPQVLQAFPRERGQWLLHILQPDGSRTLEERLGQPGDFGWPQLRLRLAPGSHAAWEDAFLAIWPDLMVEQEGLAEDTGDMPRAPELWSDGAAVPVPDSWADRDWRVEPTPESLAAVARSWPAPGPAPGDGRELLPAVVPPILTPGQVQEGHFPSGHPPRWLTLLVLLSGLSATAGWYFLPRTHHSPSAV